ncbi:MAG: hypothetical protein M1816_003287 [Peltula sp. TS41687]|nr:MAG: hypothetical protein M1816_003287 [Peltula sp. TS41687]
MPVAGLPKQAAPPQCPSEGDALGVDVLASYFPYPGDCTKYYACPPHLVGQPSTAQIRQCPAGLYWDDPNAVCDFPFEADCVQ